MNTETNTKTCIGCRKDLPLTKFYHYRGKPIPRCQECRKAYSRDWRSKTGWDQKAYHAEWRKRNREHLNARNKEWRDSNPEKMQAMRDAWAVNNPEKQKAIRDRHWEKKLKRPDFKAHNRIKSRLREAIKCGWEGRTFDLLGYTVADLLQHLERQFLKGMRWENMGEWHIDHIVPLSSFTITGPDDPELRRAWALTNLRPLWAKENLKKSSKVVFLI